MTSNARNILGLAAILTGCGDRSPPVNSVVQRDSGGVTIVNVQPPSPNDDAEEWKLSSAPALQIGSLGGEPEAAFGYISGAVRLDNGEVAVLDRLGAELRIFGPDGRFRRSLGSRGGGPGEFQMPLLVSRIDTDTLMVYDRRMRRISIFDNNHHVHTASSPMTRAEAIGAVGDRLLMERTGPITFGIEGADAKPRPVEYWLVDRKSGETRELGLFDGERGFGRTDNIGQHGYVLIPFHDRMPSVAPGRSGLAILSDQGREIRVYSALGDLQRLVRVQGPPRRVTPAALEAYIDAHTRGLTPEASDWRRRMYEDMPVPQYQPWFQTLLVDLSGLIWAEEYNFDKKAPNTWWVIGEDGQVLGYITVPPRIRITQVGRDFVLGIWQDTLDVQYVRLYRLSRRSRSAGLQ